MKTKNELFCQKENSEIVKEKVRNKKVEFFGTLLVTVGTTLIVNVLTGKGVIRADEETITTGKYF